jgi:hypothetical protein
VFKKISFAVVRAAFTMGWPVNPVASLTVLTPKVPDAAIVIFSLASVPTVIFDPAIIPLKRISPGGVEFDEIKTVPVTSGSVETLDPADASIVVANAE